MDEAGRCAAGLRSPPPVRHHRYRAASGTSIVDTELTCHAVPNLSVLSTAVFPRAGSGNPTLTLLKLGFRLAEHIRRQTEGLAMASRLELS